MMAHEVIHSLEAGKREGFLLKLDLSKAYDQVDWAFLSRVLWAFGFNSKVCTLISQHISTSSLAILINGSPSAFFKPSRGFRKGDLLSPIIFIILVECLGRLISTKRVKDILKGINPSSDSLNFTHQKFVDDTIMGGEASISKARVVK